MLRPDAAAAAASAAAAGVFVGRHLIFVRLPQCARGSETATPASAARRRRAFSHSPSRLRAQAHIKTLLAYEKIKSSLSLLTVAVDENAGIVCHLLSTAAVYFHRTVRVQGQRMRCN
jgi:hypothetical protein